MKKSTFRLIVLLMSISLIGIIAMQVIWVQNAYELKKKQFDNSVNASLRSLVEKIEDKENQGIITNEIFKMFEDSNVNKQIDVDINQLDSEINWTEQAIDSIRDEKMIVSMSKQFDTSILPKSSIKGMIITNAPGNEYDEIRIETYDSIGKKIKKLNNRLGNNKLDNVKHSFVKVVTEIVSTKPPVAERLNTVNFDSLLNNTLTTADINIKPIVKVEHNGKVLSGDSTLTTENSYTAMLFPNDLTENNATVSLQFSDKSSYAWRKITSLLAASLLFTLIIITTFLISIKTLLKQKKISEIKSDFINNMTHEFKTPIATISLAADSINTPQVIADQEKLSYYTGVIKEENERMLTQVENILQISLLDKQELDLQRDKVNIHEVLDKAIKNVTLQVEKRQGIIHKNYQAHTPIISGDIFHLTNVFTNLLDNANKYSEAAPQINIITRNTNGGIEIRFEDAGIGMKEETLKRIFDKFYRAHTGDVHNVKGFGLGLSYTQAIINAHEGNISVKSTYGKGSEFIVTLPIDEYA